ncbi:MAG: hypothetical protein IKT79_09745 [Akkermansia sp.]|nr:hypothetical protein [Akkermansia sp.]
MWKYIIISSVLFFGGSFFLFQSNHEALNRADGELALILNRFDTAVSAKTQANSEKIAAAYSEVRAKWLAEEIERQKEAQLKAEEDAALARAKGDEYKNESDTLKEETETVKRELKDVVIRTAPVVELDPDSSEPSEIIAAAKSLMDENIVLQSQIDQENEQIAALGAESERLNGLIDAARKLGQDRQARISPPELKCQVSYVDPGYAFMTLNAGIDNGGVVIGSRLAVMRGDRKICELSVTNVQSRESVAYVVKGTMLAGERVKVGDTVVSVRNDK